MAADEAAKRAAMRDWTSLGCACGKANRYECYKCSPHLYCAHGRRQFRCHECGTGLCEHGKRKDMCHDCHPDEPSRVHSGKA